MNLDDIEKLRAPLQALIDSGSRVNANKPERYWYPLSLATYDVEEVLAAVDSLCSFRTTMWEKTATFEAEFAQFLGPGEAVMVNSGSSADLVISFALRERFGGGVAGVEVLVPSVTWPTQIWSWLMAGFDVRLVDTDPDTLNMDLADLERKISSKSRIVSAVHLMGNPCDPDRLRALCDREGLLLVEDCCEALGTAFAGDMVGTFGTASAFSFFFSHHITTMEGGMVYTTDADLAESLRLLRAHGWARNSRSATIAAPGTDPRYTFLSWGFNLRPTELQAAFGSVQLGRLPSFQKRRAENFEVFSDGFARWRPQLRLPDVPPGGVCSWFALPIMLTSDATFPRDALMSFLEESGIETRPIVAGNIAKHPVAETFPALRSDPLPGADLVHDRGFYIGLHPVPNTERIERVLGAFERFMTDHK